MKNIVGYGTCVASFVLGHVLCYCDFFAHAEIGNDVLFYLGQCLIYSASFLGFRLFLRRSEHLPKDRK
jgi:hypothetical protein